MFARRRTYCMPGLGILTTRPPEGPQKGPGRRRAPHHHRRRSEGSTGLLRASTGQFEKGRRESMNRKTIETTLKPVTRNPNSGRASFANMSRRTHRLIHSKTKSWWIGQQVTVTSVQNTNAESCGTAVPGMCREPLVAVFSNTTPNASKKFWLEKEVIGHISKKIIKTTLGPNELP